MENKINIAELLKDCPEGMELDCTVFNGKICFEGFDHNNSAYPIKISVNLVNIEHLNIYGQYNTRDYAKCIIFPKGKTTWEGFHRPFVEGDVVSTESGRYIGIIKSTKDNHECCTFCSIHDKKDFHIGKELFFSRLATKEEKQIMFDIIKANGYHWNAETKTLEKLPKFKVGDRIKEKQSGVIGEVIDVLRDKYDVKVDGNKGLYVWFHKQDAWEFAPNKFDINTLVPFESKVLVRHHKTDIWMPAIFGGYYIPNLSYYVIGGTWWHYCIPYKGNEHLRGTTDECNDYYKTWE